ncbi:Wadjet anti-phage system protein JetA family protein [Carboxydothermus pertinax]|uniref:TIGR02677 family protein n=1 Tax=Carboxydothermus pertinax TaxID=870242 RepID=A0A1L8CX95_9THEO|nr:Wadjet anti-phage system protein JetA family protein [Carboxydothermus pertinax]GAV23542.1 hypothetical protein cpu_20520 [Carboxydothermus pertinax]
MKLFSVVPERFFGILAGPNREIYADLLLQIYKLYQQTPFRLQREDVIALITDVLEEREDFVPEEGEEEIGNARERANFILRRLCSVDVGWFNLEEDNDYQQYVTITEPARVMLEALEKIANRQTEEYRGYVFATYSALCSPEAELQKDLALDSAYRETRNLLNSLKTLRDNIKGYIKEAVSKTSAKELLILHFEEYTQNIIDQNYHRLKTSDHVSRYRPAIINKINEWESEYVDEIIKLYQERDKEKPEEVIRQEFYEKTSFIRTAYRELDLYLEEIDRYNALYAKSSYRQLKYLLETDRDLTRTLIDILDYIAGQVMQKELSLKDYLEHALPVKLNEFKFFNNDPLYKPRRPASEHRPEQKLVELPLEKKKELLRKTLEEVRERYSVEIINEFFLEKARGRDEVEAVELVENLEDFIKLIYLNAYFRHKKAAYVIKEDKRRFAGEKVQKGPFAFKNIKIVRKGKNGRASFNQGLFT